MNKKTSALILFSAFCIILFGTVNSGHSSSGGAPEGYTGSISDGKNCTDCHSGSAIVQSGWITSNIPSSGYVPGSTYTVTASVTSAGRSRFGFQVSPQRANGSVGGSIQITNSIQTQLVGFGKYITHKSGGISGTGGVKTWSFNWTAPVAGTGTVTFYGAFNASNANGSTTGDIIYTSSLQAVEDPGVGIAENQTAPFNVSLISDPSTRTARVNMEIETSVRVEMSIFDIRGVMIEPVFNEMKTAGKYSQDLNVSHLPSGVYIVRVYAGGKLFTRKIAVSN